MSVWILLFPCILPPVFLCLSLGKGRINSADTFTNPADIPPSLFSLETKDELVGSVTRLEGLSVTQEDRHSSSTKIFSFWKKISVTGKTFSTLCFTNILPKDFPIVNATLEIFAYLPGFDSIQSLSKGCNMFRMGQRWCSPLAVPFVM